MEFKDLVTECYNEYVAKVYKVYDIFKEYFGEENVDLQDIISIPKTLPYRWEKEYKNTESTIAQKAIIKEYLSSIGCTCNIYVHWSYVKITNEYDKSTDIYDLYAKITINYQGHIVGRFELNRSTYSYQEFLSDYMHSHIPHIPYNNLSYFASPCTGRGPINNTINSLHSKYDENMWMLFCCELNNFVSVESIAGTPYKRLENIGSTTSTNNYKDYKFSMSVEFCMKNIFSTNSSFNSEMWRNFIEYVIKSKKLTFSYQNGEYEMGISMVKCTILLTDLFIDWFNENNKLFPTITKERLLTTDTLVKGTIKNNNIYLFSSINYKDPSFYVGKKVLTFKGQDVLLNITNITTTDNSSLYLSHHVINYIVTVLLKILNFRYGKTRNKDASSSSEILL